MTGSVAPSYKELLEGAEVIQQARYAISAVYCLQLYEWITLAHKEVNLIHKSHWTCVKVAYLLCRYYPLLAWPVVMWAYLGNHTASLCTRVGLPVHILFAPCQIFPQGVMLMRAYAFSGRSRSILCLLLLCYACLIAVCIWAFCAHIVIPSVVYYIVLGGTGCFPDYGKGWLANRIGYSMLAATLMDLVSLLVVVGVCITTPSRRISLGQYFVNQGLAAFALCCSVTVIAASLFFAPSTFHNGVGLPFMLMTSNLIACRLILHLRRKVTPTESEIAHKNSKIVHEAFVTAQVASSRCFCDTDGWLVESDRDRELP